MSQRVLFLLAAALLLTGEWLMRTFRRVLWAQDAARVSPSGRRRVPEPEAPEQAWNCAG